MSIISFLREILSTEGVQTGTIKSGYTEQGNGLSDELCSKDMQIGDYYGSGCRTGNSDNINFKKIRKNVLKKENISWGDRLTYRVKNLFRSQEGRMEALRKDIEELNKLPESARIKRYSEIYREYLMEVALLDESDVEAEEKLVEMIPDLRATSRLCAAKNTVLLSESAESVHRRSRHIQRNARKILMKRDAFGEMPSREDAVEMQAFTFKNMNERGIHESLNELRESESRYQELKKLADNGELPDDLKEEYAYLQLAHTQYTTTGYAGAYAGVGVNPFISRESAEYYAGIVANDTNYFGISSEVLDLVREFAETHPEEFAGMGTEGFRAFMDKVTGGAYTARANAVSGVSSVSGVDESANSNAPEAANQLPADTTQGAEINGGNTISPAAASKTGNKKSDNKTNRTNIADNSEVTQKSQVTISNPLIQKTGNSGRAASSPVLNPAEEVPQSIAACRTVADIERYIEERKISKREACIQIFNDNSIDRYKEQYGIKLFMLIEDDMKDITFSNLSGRGKIAVSSAMSLESLQKLNISDSSYYIKMHVENLINEKEKLRGENNIVKK